MKIHDLIRTSHRPRYFRANVYMCEL